MPKRKKDENIKKKKKESVIYILKMHAQGWESRI